MVKNGSGFDGFVLQLIRSNYGASCGNPGAVGAGGLIRDMDSQWLSKFAQNIGYATAVVAELSVVKVGFGTCLGPRF